MKLQYFFELDRDLTRPLVVWGAGRNGKDLVMVLKKYEKEIHWVCNNERKIGKVIFDLQIHHFSSIKRLNRPQIIVVIAEPSAKFEIECHLSNGTKNQLKIFGFLFKLI